MSLIHEALKRAEVDKLRRSPYFNNLTVIPPAEDEIPPPVRPAEPAPPASLGVPTFKILVLVMVVTAGVGGWYLWKQYRGRLGLPATVAAQEAAAPTAQATARQPAPAGTAPMAPAVQAGRAAPPAPAVATVVDVAQPPAAAAVAMASRGDPTPAASQGPTGVASQLAAASPGAATTKKTSAASRTGRTTATKSASKLSAAKADASRYRLSAIGRGPEGNVALINDSVVQEGQTVLDAKVVKIGPTYVEMEAAGTRFTIRL